MYPGHHASINPDKAAVISAATGEIVTYRELDDRSNQLARWLQDAGLAPGDHVALLAENHVRYFEVLWAALRSGLYLTAVNWHLAPEEAAYLVNDSGSTVLIATASLSETASGMFEYLDDCPRRLMIDGVVDGFESYESALSSVPAEPLTEQPAGDVMLYSSGTTGRPKGIRRPLSGLEIDDPSRTGISSLERFLLGMDDSSVYLSPAPLYHAAPLQWGAGVHELGATLVIMDRFDASTFLENVERFGVTATQMVPTMFVRLLKLSEDVRGAHDLSSLQAVVHAAAPCPVEVKRQMIDWWGPTIYEYYAGTEANGLCFIDSAQWLEHPGSVGRAILGTVHICDEEGKELPSGQPGLIYFEQERAPFEYHHDTAKTAESRHPEHENWSKLGDIGYLDDDGYLYLTDRSAFMIISGGVNIYPQEVEACFALHPQVADVAVFGLPDPEMGEYVHAVVQLETGIEPTPELAADLREFARNEIAHYKVPRVIDFIPELPRMPTGKLQKKQVRQRYLDA